MKLKKFSDFTQILESTTPTDLLTNLETDNEFLKYAKLQGKSVTNPKQVLATCIEGNCDLVADYIASRVNGSKVIQGTTEDEETIHFFIKYKNKYYDFYNPEGVSDIKGLDYFAGINTKIKTQEV